MIEKCLQFFNDFFSNIISNLIISQYEDPLVNLENIDDPLKISEKYKNIKIFLVFWQFYSSNLKINFLSESYGRKKLKRKNLLNLNDISTIGYSNRNS